MIPIDTSSGRTRFLSPRLYLPAWEDSAFSVRWLIQEQIKGSAELNSDPKKGKIVAPLLLWGPYLWADGITPRKSDGLTRLATEQLRLGVRFRAEATISLGRFIMQLLPLLIVVLIAASLAYVRLTV